MPACCRQVFKFLVNERAVQKNPTIAAEQAAWCCPRVRPACSRQAGGSCQALFSLITPITKPTYEVHLYSLSD